MSIRQRWTLLRLKKVLNLTRQFSERKGMCTLMITHNMGNALTYGNRTILMQNGRIAMDIQGVEREQMTVEKLVEKVQHRQ